jgi:hypothetical protein
MIISIKLISNTIIENDKKYTFEIVYNLDIFNFSIFKNKFLIYQDNVSQDELDSCILTCNSINLKKQSIEDTDIDTVYRVFLFTGNTHVQSKLIFIFITYGNKVSVNNNINNNLNNIKQLKNKNIILKDTNLDIKDINLKDDIIVEEKQNEISVLKDIEKQNEISVLKDDENIIEYVEPDLEIFKDDDFINLVKIYKNKPQLFLELYKYINSSEIIKINKNTELNYDENLLFIKNLNFDFTDENILNALTLTGNNINLSVRYLLSNL